MPSRGEEGEDFGPPDVVLAYDHLARGLLRFESAGTKV